LKIKCFFSKKLSFLLSVIYSVFWGKNILYIVFGGLPMLYNSRTDLASESFRQLGLSMEDLSRDRGVIARQERLHGMELFAVDIINNVGAELLGKRVGKYFTLDFSGGSAVNIGEAAAAVGDIIGRCCKKKGNVLVAALGNPDITPDALGNLAADNVIVTRHLKGEALFEDFGTVALCRTGVLGTSGIESFEQIRLLCEYLRPELVIVIDALAGADMERLCRCIQISTGGICPGSGVGNDRREINGEVLGVPVVAIGVPTVIDAGCLGDNGLRSMFVTPKDIDIQVRVAGRIIGYGINFALHEGISFEEIEMLVG
jgi:spore protease